MTEHKAVATHLKMGDPRRGWQRWAAECPCGYSEVPRWPITVNDLVEDHNDRHGVPDDVLPLSCTCYDPDSMEYAPEPCDYCKRLDAEEIA